MFKIGFEIFLINFIVFNIFQQKFMLTDSIGKYHIKFHEEILVLLEELLPFLHIPAKILKNKKVIKKIHTESFFTHPWFFKYLSF